MLFYLALFCLSAGIPCWGSGHLGVHFHESARDNFVKTECLLLKTEEVWGWDEDAGAEIVQRLDWKYMFVPNTGVNETVYTISTSDENAVVRREAWRTDTVNATYLWIGGNDTVWGGVKTDGGWLKTEWCWVQPGELEPNQLERTIIWSPIKALESGPFQDLRAFGIGLTVFGIVVVAAFVCTPAVTRAYPLCTEWARSVHVSIASASLLLGLAPTFVIPLIWMNQLKPYEHPAVVMWIVALVLIIWTICVMLVSCCVANDSIRRHQHEQLGLLSRPGSTPEGTGVNAV